MDLIKYKISLSSLKFSDFFNLNNIPENKTISLTINLNNDFKNLGQYEYLENTDIFPLEYIIDFGYELTLNNNNTTTIQFYNYSTIDGSYLWDFGDGETLLVDNKNINPSHTYNREITNYSVKLEVKNPFNQLFKIKPINVVNIIDNKSEIIEDYLNNEKILITGTTNSKLNELIGYRKTIKVGDIRGNKKVIGITGNTYEYIEDNDSLTPITYIDNGVKATYSFYSLGSFTGNTFLNNPIYKKENYNELVEPIKINNNIFIERPIIKPYNDIIKLTEINSLNKLEKYQNNNIQININ